MKIEAEARRRPGMWANYVHSCLQQLETDPVNFPVVLHEALEDNLTGDEMLALVQAIVAQDHLSMQARSVATLPAEWRAA